MEVAIRVIVRLRVRLLHQCGDSLPLSSFGGCASVLQSRLHFLCDTAKLVVEEVDTEVDERDFTGLEGW